MDAAICLVTVVFLTAGEFGKTLGADSCASNPCSNGGTCVNEHGGYSCLCPAGYSGPLCEQKQNIGGRLGLCPVIRSDMVGLCVQDCTDDASCPAPLKCCSNGCGHVCTVPLITDDMNWCMSDPCGNGGTCVYNGYGYGCLCDDGPYVSSNCEVDVLQSSAPTSSVDDNSGIPADVAGNQQLPTTIIAAVCSVIVVAILLILGVIFLYCRHRKQATDSDTVSVDSGKQIIMKGPERSPEPFYINAEYEQQLAVIGTSQI